MHGAGNDFVVLDATHHPIDLSEAQYRLLANRQFGVGADQILIVGRPHADDTRSSDFSYRIYNSDGGEVEQCGNGARAFVRFVHEHGLSTERQIRVSTPSGVIVPRLEDDGSVTVDMGPPALEPRQIPFDPSGLAPTILGGAHVWPLVVAGEAWPGVVVSMGNPHVVLRVDDVEAAPVQAIGPLVEYDARFAERVNVGFVEFVSDQHIRLRVWERGTGETLACGTGACAAVVAGILMGELRSPVRVTAHGGELRIEWAGPGNSVFMNGPAVTTFEGEIDLDQLVDSAPPFALRPPR